MRQLELNETLIVSGGGDESYDYGHRIGETVRELYDGAVEAMTDLFVWIDELDGSLGD
jgi:hypothetical protein